MQKATPWEIKLKKVSLFLISCFLDSVMDDKTKLTEYGIITPFLERCFLFLQNLSGRFVYTPPSFSKDFGKATLEERIEETKRRTTQIDRYIIMWWLTVIVAALITWHFSSRFLGFVACAVVTVRIIDILQVGVNMSLFNQFRVGKEYMMASTVRSVVLTVLNYFELIGCFGVIYAANIKNLTNSPSWGDAFYFSCITQLTIGYGDISPLGSMRVVACVQGIIGMFFAILILGRFIAMLPTTRALAYDEFQEE